MNKFAIDGREMAYLDIGQGPVIVLGHCYLWDSQMWAPQIDALSQHYRCIVPELWAHGHSDNAPIQTRTLQDYARHVLALMDHLAIEQFSLIGLSVGGMWGAEVVIQAPERVRSLVLMDTFVGLEPEVTHQKYFSMLENIAANRQVSESLIEAITPLFFAHNAKDTSPQLVQHFAQSLKELKGERAVEVARVGKMAFGRRDLIEEIEKFALPVLIAVGQEDKPRPVLESYLMHDCIAGSTLIEIPSAGHISNLEQAEFVTKMLCRFLTDVHQ